ncbi:MAG TPA: ABC transporter substrate-binding protein, partial [Bryobacteraceae bacterium]
MTVDLSGTFPLDAAAMPPLLAPLVAETLTRINARGDLEPGLATAWQAEADAKRWRISLRNGVLFHDGEPLNAGSVESI